MKLTVFVISTSLCTERGCLVDLAPGTARHVDVSAFGQANLHCKQRDTAAYASNENVMAVINLGIYNGGPIEAKKQVVHITENDSKDLSTHLHAVTPPIGHAATYTSSRCSGDSIT